MATLGTVSLPKSAYLQVCKGHFYGNFMLNKVLLYCYDLRGFCCLPLPPHLDCQLVHGHHHPKYLQILEGVEAFVDLLCLLISTPILICCR